MVVRGFAWALHKTLGLGGAVEHQVHLRRRRGEAVLDLGRHLPVRGLLDHLDALLLCLPELSGQIAHRLRWALCLERVYFFEVAEPQHLVLLVLLLSHFAVLS